MDFVAETSFGGTNFVKPDRQSKDDIAARGIGCDRSCHSRLKTRRGHVRGRHCRAGGISHEANNAGGYLSAPCLRADGGESNRRGEKHPMEAHEMITYDPDR